ncbi:hypothetical protein CcCBS67573_g04674 [Chytriomyces confervae]|uniref:Mitochondrial carrier n=1 Tax=Chytriomyces confervae TaxID=246404 RepID=A0A507FFI1_9FUNG|nr:hypothetical protein HDU80_002721 [Chytriomyces hyalinus]TPX74046.1 hypothetical protein CcCBS67573_g04674 [Chytriomyces confervae]
MQDEEELEALFGDNRLTFAAAKYIASVCASPVEVVNVLRMVEYVPTDAFVMGHTLGHSHGHRRNNSASSSPAEKGAGSETGDDGEEDADEDAEDMDDELSDGDTEVPPEAYEYTASSGGKDAPPPFSDAELESINEATLLLKNTDAQGYLIRSGRNDEDDPTRPPYEISVEGKSTFQSVFGISNCEAEGFLSLFKGHYLSWLHDLIHTAFLQPTLEQSLNDAFAIADETAPLVHLENPYPPLAMLVASHTISSFILSPLELVRTRLIVQTGNPYHRKYKSNFTFMTLFQIVREEGIGSLYASRRVFATALLCFLQPAFKYAGPVLIHQVGGVDAEFQPLLYRAMELSLGVVELLVVLPVETIVRRLESQVVGRHVRGGSSTTDQVDVGGMGGNSMEAGGGSGEFAGMVRTSAIPYTGMFDCARRIIVEEGVFENEPAAGSLDYSDDMGGSRRHSGRGHARTKKSKKPRKKAGWFTPLSGLYRGLRMRIYVNITVTLLRALSADD